MTNAALLGKPEAGNPHVRFDEGEVALAATPRRGSLLYKNGVIRIAVSAYLLSAFSVYATDWYASPDGTGGGTSPTDRGEVITVSRSMNTGDILYLAPGTYNLDKSKSESQKSGSGVYVCLPTMSNGTTVSNLTFVGESDNPEDVRLVGTQADKMRIFYCGTGGHVIRNVLISGGYTDYQGAGICAAAGFSSEPEKAFMISNCIVENCSAAYQGANAGGAWRNCVIRNNTVRNTTAAKPGAGNTENEGSGGGVFGATLYDCVITNNTAGFCGGGIAGGRRDGLPDRNICPTRAYNCLIGWNRAKYGAGAGVTTNFVTTTSFDARTYCQLYNCTVVSNTASMVGGGAHLCAVSNSVVRGNSSTWDNGSATSYATYRMGGGGGAAFCDIFGSRIEANRSIRGGAGAMLSKLVRCDILDNVATGNPNGYGGGTYACSLVQDCLLTGNKANYGGAGFNGYFENCVMTNNEATARDGGATYNATTRNCIVVGNLAGRFYAHCRGAHYGDLVYGNKNLQNPAGNRSASGIGADEGQDGEGLPVVNCTVWGNLNGSANVSRASLTNSVVWSVTDMDTHSAVNSFWRSGTVANQTGCISGTDKDPKFVGVDGTAALTEAEAKSTPWTAFMLRSSSPCRDAGLLLPGQTSEKDVLGNPRVKHVSVDMGALECVQAIATMIIIR